MSEYPAVRQVLLTLRLMRLIAQSRVRNRYDPPEELRLLPCIERLLEIVSKPEQLRFVQNVLYISMPAGLPDERMPTGMEKFG
jgi:hypothetical protein